MPKKITVPVQELYDPRTGTFFYSKGATFTIEHSLVSLSKWEQKWKKPFLNKEHPVEEFDDYIRCMTITQNIDPEVYKWITPEIRKEIQEYMEDPMTAAVIHEIQASHRSTKFTTADLIYCWMVQLRIPPEYQKWHLNRLLTLIRIVNIESNPNKKMSKAESARHHHSTNQARRAKLAARKR